MEILEKYRKYFKIEEQEQSTEEIMKLVDKITEFHKFCREKVAEATAMKEIMGRMRDTRENEIKA